MRRFQRVFGIRKYQRSPFTPAVEGVLCVGQSNGSSQETLDDWDPTGLDVPDDRVFEHPHGGGPLLRMGDTFNQDDIASASEVSWQLHFAKRRMIQRRAIEKMVFVNRQVGGTGFVDERWRPGDDLYEAAVSDTNIMLEANPDVVLRWVVMSNTENEMALGATGKEVYVYLKNFIEGLRRDIEGASEETSFIWCEPANFYIHGSANGKEILRAVRDLSQDIENFYICPTANLPLGPDGRHLEGPELRLKGKAVADTAFSVGVEGQKLVGPTLR